MASANYNSTFLFLITGKFYFFIFQIRINEFGCNDHDHNGITTIELQDIAQTS
jgi:hypothetical protein